VRTIAWSSTSLFPAEAFSFDRQAGYPFLELTSTPVRRSSQRARDKTKNNSLIFRSVSPQNLCSHASYPTLQPFAVRFILIRLLPLLSICIERADIVSPPGLLPGVDSFQGRVGRRINSLFIVGRYSLAALSRSYWKDPFSFLVLEKALFQAV